MSKAHVNDTDLQRYATGAMDLDAAKTAHLEDCPHCRASAVNYRLLFGEISQAEQPAFTFDVHALVLAQLPAPRRAFPWSALLIWGFSLLLVLASVAFFWSALATLARGFSGSMGPIAAAGAAAVIVFQGIAFWRGHQRKMLALGLEKNLQL